LRDSRKAAKRADVLEKNQMAAARCRVKRRDDNKRIKSHLDELIIKNNQLHSAVSEMWRLLSQLKLLLPGHKQYVEQY